MADSFKPAWWMRNPHLQTIIPSKVRKLPAVDTRRERWTLPDGDFVDIDLTPDTKGPLVILLHGLEGSAESQYIQAMFNHLHRIGWQGVGMHFRGCSGEDNHLPRSYHSGETEDFDFILKELNKRYPSRRFAAAGYSLGGSALLNWLAQNPDSSLLAAASAVSVPYELDTCAHKMNTGFSRVYRNHFIKTLRDKVVRKAPVLQQHKVSIDFDTINRSNDFWVFDDLVTAPIHGFPSAKEYYSSCSTKPKLKDIRCPTLLVHALDDPFMTPDCAPSHDDISPAIELEISKHGGHLGFVGGKIPFRPDYGWLDQRVMEFFVEKLRQKPELD